MTATLKIRREGFGIELRRGWFEVTVDGDQVGSIEHRETVQTPTEPGHHTLQIQAGRYSSREQSFDAADGEVVNLRCHGAMVWPRYVASMLEPDLAVSLRVERASAK